MLNKMQLVGRNTTQGGDKYEMFSMFKRFHTRRRRTRHYEVYTIVEEADGPGASKWGRLKSGAGWISLDFVKKMR